MSDFTKWLTHKGCPGCGHSKFSKLEWITMVGITLALFVGGVFTLQACNTDNPHKTDAHPHTQVIAQADEPKPHKDGDPETLPAGFIRRINWEQRTLMYESVDGFTRILGPVCKHPDMLPVWEGMAVSQINFRWIDRYTEGDTLAGECYSLDWVGHDPAHDVHESKIVGASGVSR